MKWVVELHSEPEGRSLPQPLYLCRGSPTQIAERVIRADDAGEIGIGSAWTKKIDGAAIFDEAGAKQTAGALDRCCQGYAVAALKGPQP